MKPLVIYDSTFGNTKIIAEVIAKELDGKIIPAADADLAKIKEAGLIVVGSPIIGWKPSENMGRFLDTLKKDALKGIKAATFDTRVKLFIHGDAVKKIMQKLAEAGAEMIAEPEMFYVKGKEGPLFDGEIEKAKKWAVTIISAKR